jgi:CubicO group peptidase (beta-lactamase class C family)
LLTGRPKVWFRVRPNNFARRVWASLDASGENPVDSAVFGTRLKAMGRLLLGLVTTLAILVAAQPAAAIVPFLFDQAMLDQTVAEAGKLPRLHALIVARSGTPVVERVFRGPSLNTPVNVKSASKSVISALVGIALDRGLLKNPDQPILPLLKARAPSGLDPRVGTITLDHLLSMRAGLERTSGVENYGRWVTSPNWVRFALSRPFVDKPGGGRLYSTGNTHLLSAILTEASKKSTFDLAREWLGKPLGITIPAWTRDPQGIYFGGNEMALSPRALLRFGEMYRNGGVFDGKRVVPEEWIRESWTPRSATRRGDGYGYGWFITEAHGQPIYFAWGFGGQMLYIAPTLAMTVVITSDFNTRSTGDGYQCALQSLMTEGFVPAALGRSAEEADTPWTFSPCGSFGFRQL